MSSKLNLKDMRTAKVEFVLMKTTYRSGLGASTFSMRPAASILSMIFCLDLACRTRLAYVPAEAINLCKV